MNSRECRANRRHPLVKRLVATCCGWLAAATLVIGEGAAQAAEITCHNSDLPIQKIIQPTTANPNPEQPDVVVKGTCNVPLGKDRDYYYRNINIIGGGELSIRETGNPANSETHLWASAIIIEADSYLIVGGDSNRPFGYYGGTMTFHLYGKDESLWDETKQEFSAQNAGAVCKSDPTRSNRDGPCGVPLAMWTDNGGRPWDLPGAVTDYFYQYAPLYGDGRCDNGLIYANGACPKKSPDDKPKVGYFGAKMIAVSWGGNLHLHGFKGATYDGAKASNPLYSGSSWMRLADGNSLEPNSSSLYLERNPETWRAGDEIVVTTTDYLPSHSERLKITNLSFDSTKNAYKVDFQALDVVGKTTNQWWHNGARYGGPNDKGRTLTARLPERIKGSISPDLRDHGAETRAAVALLSRSIKIVSEGDKAGRTFAQEKADYYYGGHLVVRQGAQSTIIQGVEFQQMGQGGRLGHYPIHFHMARQTSTAIVSDSSINESMTRWIVLHSTQGARLERNVGYKSIGHGFYLEDGTETDNKFHSNIGILARAAVKSQKHNPRQVPGILADNQGHFAAPKVSNPGMPYRSDVEYPTVFWITNGWNDFIGNMAAGAGTCGAAFWFVPAANSDHIEVTANDHDRKPMKWSGYAALQGRLGGTTPLKSFYKNYATSTMHSFQASIDGSPCSGVIAADATVPDQAATLQAVKSIAPRPTRTPDDIQPDNNNDHYYPHVRGYARLATLCPEYPNVAPDCSTVPPCADGSTNDGRSSANCTVVVLDHYTSSFHWAQGDVSAIWLRPQWYLMTNSVVTDVQNGGLTMVSGGDYTRSSVISGYWALARNSIFVGNTNPNPDTNRKYMYTGNTGPFNGVSGLKCDAKKEWGVYCLNADEGITMPTDSFFTNQRLVNIYDGPSYQDSNAYLDISKADCPLWDKAGQGAQGSCMYGSNKTHLRLKTVPGNANSSCIKSGDAYLPNAAIGWKQPNGFYYAPAFHSKNLFFDKVELRHYVIDPLFKTLDDKYKFGQGGTYLTDNTAVKEQYCTPQDNVFDNWTAIDRQTELNDDDGTLTGLTNTQPDGRLKQTISVNEDMFFTAPVEAPECASAVGDNAKPENACTPAQGKAPVTAKTSPFDHLTTVVFHQPADKDTTDIWDRDCSGPTCYGVPLYRQYLTPQERKLWTANDCDGANKSAVQCRWPFIRMSGMALFQRQTMTINNGRYYLDTTVSHDQQKTEAFTAAGAGGRFYNVFRSDRTYTVFFVYAKPETVQTYQIYVGDKFTEDDVKAVRVGIAGVPDPNPIAGPRPNWLLKPEVSGGMLTVTVRFKDVAELEPTPANGLCQPRTFCQPSNDKKSCVTALEAGHYLLQANPRLRDESKAVCENWAMRDLDCPPAGCLGFSFTLKAPVADNTNRRERPLDFPTAGDANQGQPDWATRFRNVSTDKSSDQCFYKADAPPISKPCP